MSQALRILAGCLVAMLATTAAAQQLLSLAQVKVAIPLTVSIEEAALEAAIAGGGFKAEGLTVEVVRFRSWSEPVQAIVSDAAHFAFGGASLIRAAIGSNAPVRQIAMVSTRYPYGFWVKPDSGIRTIADVRGKTIHTVRVGETLDTIWVQVLAAHGLAMADVKRVETFNGFGSLLSGTVDIANMNGVEISRARKAGFVQVLDYNDWRQRQGMRVGDGTNLGWGTSLKMLTQHPDTVRAFLRALAAATVRLRDDRAFAVAVLTGDPFKLDAETAAELFEIHRGHWIIRLDPAKGDYSFDVEMVEIALGRPKGSIEVGAVAAPEPVAAVLREMKITF